MSFQKKVIVSQGPEETFNAGKLLGMALRPPDVVALIGELGSGKTVFAKGVACGLGFGESDLVTSPTYKLMNQYRGRVLINHFDAYRLDNGGDFVDIGGVDFLAGDSVSIIEWAERVSAILPSGSIEVHIKVLSESVREIEFSLPPGRGEQNPA